MRRTTGAQSGRGTVCTGATKIRMLRTCLGPHRGLAAGGRKSAMTSVCSLGAHPQASPLEPIPSHPGLQHSPNSGGRRRGFGGISGVQDVPPGRVDGSLGSSWGGDDSGGGSNISSSLEGRLGTEQLSITKQQSQDTATEPYLASSLHSLLPH